jgi:hypothetical protein
VVRDRQLPQQDFFLDLFIPTIVERAWQVGSFQALEEFEKTIDRQ